jgi:peroxiredoxin
LASDIVDAKTTGVVFAETILVLQGIVRFDKPAAASPTCSTRDLANLHSSECLYPAEPQQTEMRAAYAKHA